MRRVTIMSKPGCHNCEAAVKVVQLVVGQQAAVLIEEIDITSDQGLHEKYQHDIPVVLVDGVVRFKHKVDPEALAELFADEPGINLTGIM